MKKLIFFFLFSGLFSCEAILENAIEDSIDNKPKLMVRVKNDTPFLFKRTEIIANNGKVVFQPIDPSYYGSSDQFLSVYDEIEISIKTENKHYYYKPLFYKESTLVTKGSYIFEVSLSESNNSKIVIKRVKF